MICVFQAFKIISNASEALDNMLTDSLKRQMPPNGLKALGNNQLEETTISEPHFLCTLILQ